MNLKDKVMVVTGGANGIGAALCRRFAQEQPRGLVIADLEFERTQSLASELHALAVPTNVAHEADIINLVKTTNQAYGPIDVFVSNAGIGGAPGGIEAPNEAWQNIWEVNLMAHVYAARAVIPQMLERGSGYLVNTASAAGLLSQIGAAGYAVTKHAAVAFAEWLSITYGDRGIKVSCLCPQGVRTRMLETSESGGIAEYLRNSALTPEYVADCVVQAIAEEKFLILPHPEVAEYLQRKATDYDRWLRGMRKLLAQVQC